jgi:DNA-directed RNA polymerase specialized sigma subunit
MELETREYYENIAIKVLNSYRKPITDENVGMVISYLMTADTKYKKEIGNLQGFRKMYSGFAIKEINKFNNRAKHTIFVDDLTVLQNVKNATYKDKHVNLFWEEVEKNLTKIEYDAIIGRFLYNKTLSHIGGDLKISAEGVRLMINRALNKLRGVM